MRTRKWQGLQAAQPTTFAHVFWFHAALPFLQNHLNGASRHFTVYCYIPLSLTAPEDIFILFDPVSSRFVHAIKMYLPADNGSRTGTFSFLYFRQRAQSNGRQWARSLRLRSRTRGRPELARSVQPRKPPKARDGVCPARLVLDNAPREAVCRILLARQVDEVDVETITEVLAGSAQALVDVERV